MLGAQVVVAQQPLDLRREAEVEQVGGAEVDRDAEVVAGSRSAAHLLERAVEDERGQRPRQAALLDEREEVAGAEQAALGVVPAHERLDAAHRAGPQLRLRLVVQDELAGLERGAELADEREPLAAVVVAADHVDLVAGAHALGLVHRDVGALQQAHGVAGVGGEQRDADAGVDVDADAADGEGVLERRAQPQPGGARRRLVARLEDDRELVAAEARERVVVAQELLQARADLAQHLVAGVVAERVVELLEAVEVDQQQRQLAVALGRGRDRGVQRVDEVAAVAEAGEVVGARLRAAVAQALDHRQPRAGHAGEDRHGRERGGDGSIAVNCPTVSSVSAAVAKTRMIVRTTGLNSGPGSGGGWCTHAAAAMRERRGGGEPRPGGQRGEAGEREQHRPARPPAAQREAPGHAGGADRLDRARPDRHGHAGGGGRAHRRVEPRQPVDGAEAGEHEQRHGAAASAQAAIAAHSGSPANSPAPAVASASASTSRAPRARPRRAAAPQATAPARRQAPAADSTSIQ